MVPAAQRGDIFVIRDVPQSRNDTRDCVTRAVARRGAALWPRAGASRRDLQAVAAGQTDSKRAKLIDLAPLMCDDDNCFPVGGALVIRDIGLWDRSSAAPSPGCDAVIVIV